MDRGRTLVLPLFHYEDERPGFLTALFFLSADVVMPFCFGDSPVSDTSILIHCLLLFEQLT